LRRRSAAGFTYLSLVILLAIIGLVSATTLKLGVILQRAAAERELLNIGAQFSDALESYAKATPAGQLNVPPTLNELLRDPRFPGVRRHLRRIFVDPMTGKAEWGIQYASGTTGVLGVYSLSDAKPIKIANFPARFQGLEGKLHLSDWKFGRNANAVQPPAQPGQLGQPGQPGSPVAGQPGQPGQSMFGQPGQPGQPMSGQPAPGVAPPPATPVAPPAAEPPVEPEPAEPAEPKAGTETPPPEPEKPEQ
jgi:type II secretory pathway pseudopilin PulG